MLARKVNWCGKIISSHSWKYDEKYFNSVLNIPKPIKLGHLEDIVYTCIWISLAVPKFSTVIEPLNDLMRLEISKAKSTKGKLLKRKQRYNLDLKEWDSIHTSGMLCQIEDEEAPTNSLQLLPSKIRPMEFLAGKFNGSMFNWSMPEKEFYPVIHTLNRFDFLTRCHPEKVLIYTDHKKLFFLFILL